MMQDGLTEGKVVYTVSQITRALKTIIEDKFSFVWICGEISNLSIPASGHCYFTLKDEKSQINAVIFRNQTRNLKFRLEDGIKITGFGRLSIYEPRGTYQFIFEYLEPSGIGSLQLAFEQLKNRLDAEGLFDPVHKKEIPFLPEKISVITSPTGAVIRDIINVVSRRFPDLPIEIYPVKVQGDGSDKEIVSGLTYINDARSSDVIILARGGGSLEDLASFNSEIVARAIFNSDIPVISAVGHETDFTISDFVADLRAPTPSAAAELAVPEKTELLKKCDDMKYLLLGIMNGHIKKHQHLLLQLNKRLKHPRKKIQDMQLRLDDQTFRLIKAIKDMYKKKQSYYQWQVKTLYMRSPQTDVYRFQEKLAERHDKLQKEMDRLLTRNKYLKKGLDARLTALNPTAILNRGYSITRKLPKKEVVRNSADTSIHETLEIQVAQGKIVCRVEGIENGQKNI